VIPGRKSVYQAGFLVTRRLPITINETVDIVKEGNYVEGFGRDNGWYGLGYGGSVGSMAMQGLMAYYYDHVRNLTVVELDQCQFNHMGMTVQTPSGQCRTMKSTCEDCRTTPIDNIYNVHYTACRKPWTCVGTSSKNGKKDNVGPRETAIDTRIASLGKYRSILEQIDLRRFAFDVVAIAVVVPVVCYLAHNITISAHHHLNDTAFSSFAT